MSSYQSKVYRVQGGDETIVASGGVVTVKSGGVIAVETGGDITINAVSLVDELAALNGLDATELGYLNGVTAGTVTASKAVVVDANKDAATFRNLTLSGNLVTGTTTLSETDLAVVDAVTAGTGAASKALVLSAGEDVRMPVGGVFAAGILTKAQGVPTAKTVTAAITAAELAGGIVTTTGVTAPSIHQLPTGTLLAAEFPGIAVGDSFDFHVINTGTGITDDATITVNTDVTIVGNPTIGSLTDATIISGSGTFRARYSAANTFVVYRIA